MSKPPLTPPQETLRPARALPPSETHDSGYAHRARIASLTGRPYEIRTDAWEATPGFGFAALADAIAKVIVSSVPQLTLAVYGPWGSGKTTLLHAINDRVNSHSCPVVWFDMWEHKDQADVIPYLLARIADRLPGRSEFRDQLLAFARATLASATLTAGQVSFNGGTLLKELDRLWDDAPPLGRDRLAEVIQAWRRHIVTSSQSSWRQAFARSFADGIGVHPRIVVVIDNLDRCLPAQAVQMLEQTSSLFDFEGIVFLLAAEHERLATAVEKIYDLEQGDGARYLEKLVQVEFGVPTPEPSLVVSWIEQALGDTAFAITRPDAELIAEAAEWNPRAIKRLLNNARMQLCATRPEFARERGLVLSSTLLLEADPDAWRKLLLRSSKRPTALIASGE
jgi:hypothetical protein